MDCSVAPVTINNNHQNSSKVSSKKKYSKGGWNAAIFVICKQPFFYIYGFNLRFHFPKIIFLFLNNFFNVFVIVHAVVEMAERFAFYGLAGNLITYLTNNLSQPVATAAKNVNTWVGVSSIFPLLGAFIADSYLGRFKTILASSLLYFLVSSYLRLLLGIPDQLLERYVTVEIYF